MEAFKENKNNLIGKQIIIHTDHQNLIYKTFNSGQARHWHLCIEKYAPDLCYIKKKNKKKYNVVADALSRLAMDNEPMPEACFPEELCSVLYCYEVN